MTEHEQLNLRILDDHFGSNRLSYTELEKKYGRSKSSLERLIRPEKKAGRKFEAPSAKKVDPRSVAARKPLSSLHARLGLKVLRYRLDRDLNYSEMGRRIGTSRARVGPIEAGSYDLTLMEVSKIAEVIGQPFEQLFVFSTLGTQQM